MPQLPDRSRRVETLTLRTILLALAASAMFAGGCSKGDNAKQAVSDAGLEFRKVSVGDPTMSADFSGDVYTEAGRLVSEYAGDESPYAEAAAVSVALSKLGLATLAGGEASDAETHAMHQGRVIRGHLSEWIAMNAVAKASTNFDTSEEKKALQELIQLRAVDVQEYAKLLDSQQNEIQSYQSQIDDLESKAVSERNESARFELQMTSVTATKAAQLAERVREHSLRADAYELEGERLRGRVGQLLPGAHEVELQVLKANNQIALLNDSINELDQRVRDAKQDSAQARANAQNAQNKLTELVDALEEYRDQTVTPASEKVITLIRQSLSASKDARDTIKTSGAIAKASAQEQLGQALSRQARGHADMVSLYQSLMESGVPGQWQSKLDAHSETYEQLKGDARQAFQDAASALRSVRARGPQGETIEAAALRLDRLGGVEPEPVYSEDAVDENDGYQDEEYQDDESQDEEFDN